MISTITPESTATLLRTDVVTELRNLAVVNLVTAGQAYATGDNRVRGAHLQAASVISLVANVLDAQLAVVITPADIERIVASVRASFGPDAHTGTGLAFEQIGALAA